MNVSRGIPLFVAALLVSGCGSETFGGPGDGAGTPDLPTSRVGTSTPQDSATTGTPTPSPPLQKDAAPPVAGGPCQPSQLVLQAGLGDAAMGFRQMDVTATNTSDLTCVVNGVPAPVMYGHTGRRLTPVIEPGALTGEEARTNVARQVRLKPGQRAFVLLQWRNNLAAAGVEQTSMMTLTVTRGGVPVLVNRAATPESYSNPGEPRPPRPGETAMPIEIVDGTKVQIGGWTPYNPSA